MKQMKKIRLAMIVMCSWAVSAAVADPSVAEVTHWQLQDVNSQGVGIYEATDKVMITGIILNNPEEMLDPTPGYTATYQPWNMGGEWQIFIQGEGDDHAGTALWMGQNYGNLPWKADPNLSYTDAQWISELCRLNHDLATGHTFTKGDRVKVTGWHKFFGGKTNINEQHFTDPNLNFTIELIDAAAGLPQAEVVTLDQLKDGNDVFIFDAGRTSGCEYYQGRLVRVNDVNFISGTWGPGQMMTIEDVNGLTFPVHLGIGSGFSKSNNLTVPFDVIGIMNQEDDSQPHSGGYEIWVTNYDGNGFVLTDRGYSRSNLPGDINHDYEVDFEDFAQMAADWLKCTPGLCDCP